MLWTALSPEVIQQSIRLNEELLGSILKHFDECMTTRMSEEFWAFSNTAWAKCERHASPSLKTKIDFDSEQDYWNDASSTQLHRRHKEVCKSQKGTITRCRFGMPAGRWPRPTCPVSLFLVQQKVGKDKYKDVVDCRLECKRSDMPCTHAYSCTCETPQDLADIGKSGPTIIESSRPLADDCIVTNHTKKLLQATASNCQTTLLSTTQQCNAIIPYIIKYTTKHKTSLAQCVTSVLCASKKIKEASAPVTQRSFLNKMINSVAGQNEIPATVAAFVLMGNRACSSTSSYWFVFVWDAVSPTLLDQLKFQQPAAAKRAPRKRREASTSTFETDLLQEDRYIECISSDGQVFNVNGMFVAAKQFQIYEHRPTELEDMCFLSFCICTELVEIKDGTPLPAPEEERKNGARKLNQRFRLLPASPLESAYIVMIHSKFKVPILAGQPPPECPPIDEETEAAKKGRKRWALFWGTALLPWRDRNLVSCDDAAFFSWILRSLKEQSGSINRAKALFCLSTTFMSRKTVLHSKCLDLWRYRNAAIKTDKDAVATNRTSEEQDEAVLQDIAAIADQLVIGMGRSGEDSHAQNIRRQVECMLPEQRTTAAVPTRKTCIFNNSAILTECCKSVETFEDSTAMTNQATDGEERHQIPQLIPDTPQLSEELNAQQVALINKVYAAVKEKRQALIFVQGEAGTGKTFCVKEMYNCLSKHFGQNCLRCLAPTGVSAENLLKGTLTIHKGLCIDPKRNRVDRLPANKQPVLHMRYDGTLVFVVDEISMVSPQLLLRISQRLKELALLCGAENSASDFGGFTVVLMGDFLQIPPVRSKSLLEEALYPSSGPTTLDVFLGGLLFRKFELIVFTQQMRAQEVG